MRAYAALALGVVAIAWSAIFVRWAGIAGVASAFWRMLIALLVLWPFALTGNEWRRFTLQELGWVLLGGLCFAGDVGLYNVAVLHTGAGMATLLGNNAPLVVGLFTWLFTRKSPTRRFWLALLLALAGSWMMVTVDQRESGTRGSADLMAVGASVCFALYMLTTERVRRRRSAGAVLAVSVAASCVVLLLLAVGTHTSLRVPTPHAWLALLGLGLVCQVGGYFALTYALGHVPATVSSVTMLAVAPVTACLAWAFFGEQLSAAQMFGGVLVLMGVAAVSLERAEIKPAER